MFQIRTLVLLLFVCRLQAQNDDKRFYGNVAHRQLNSEKKLREELTTFTIAGTVSDFSLKLNFEKSDLFSKNAANSNLNSSLLSMRYLTLSANRDYGFKNGYQLNTQLFTTWSSESNEELVNKNAYFGGSVLAGKRTNKFSYFVGLAYDTYFGTPQVLPTFYLNYKYKNLIEAQASPRLTYIKYYLKPSHIFSIELDNQSKYGKLDQSKTQTRINEVNQMDFSLIAKFEFKAMKSWTSSIGVGHGIYQEYKTSEATIKYSNNYSFNLSFNYQF
ncbi:DUF6268 family outer membrane beta-barrel protein [Flavobacterium sp.]|uniref:DUF6268 family outer membrane beta-barrel protein n=1 Tax=Flavobacterium sp. TaxID=239 RepID=UPI002628C2B0|nr:DUF6268 family outer membrane beta-barrel protein [Flavobacterium sp.]